MTAPTKPLQPRTNALLWVLLGVVGVLGTGYVYTLPQIEALREIRLSSAALAADKQAYELQISQLTALDERLEQHQPALDQLSLAVPDQPAVDELLVSLGAVASRSGIVLATIQPSSEVTPEGVTVSLTAKGSYAGIHLFLDALGTNQRPIKVTEVGLAAASDVAGASLVTASLQLVAATAGSAQPSSPASAAADQTGLTPSPASEPSGPGASGEGGSGE